MASSQRPQHSLPSTAQEKTQEDFEFNDDSLNRKCLTSCLTFLCDNLTVEEVIIRLRANYILTLHEADLIRAKETRLNKNQIFVDFVQQRGPEAFSCFMKSLTETGQKYIFEKLIEERKTIGERENQSTFSMWSTKLMSATRKFNLESLIREEELEQLKNIRVKKIPEQIGQIGKGAYGKVLLFKFEDGSFRAGKKPKINLENKSPEEERELKKYLSYALGEIKILHQLDHERIIGFYGFYLDQGQMIIFMEAMRGSVKDEINEKRYLSEMKAMNYFIQTAEGLVYLHSRRPTAIVHRDIKCENLLLTVECNVKLADFGLAINLVIDNGSRTNLSTAPKSYVGTHLFHAPEIIQTVNTPEAYGRKSDIWSLACTLVQMVNGEPPYRNLSLIELIQRSSATSQNPLKYSGNVLLPAASNDMKKLLDAMFIADYKLRPNAEKVLELAHDVVKTFSNDSDIENKLKDDNQQHTLNSLTNDLQSISLNNPQTLTERASAENVHSVSNLIPASQQQTAFKQGEHENNSGGILKEKEDPKSGRNEAEQGEAEDQNKLGDAYYNGHGVIQSHEDAVKWYRKAAEQGHARAQFNLGFMYSKGKGVPQSDDNALKWYRKAAEKGYAAAQCHIGFMYEKGRGAPQSDEEAVNWFRKSAQQGHAEAQFKLGSMNQVGKSINQSYEEAVKWYTKSAEQGHAEAQFKLGSMYQAGKGVNQSDEEAINWYGWSALQGHAAAQYSLGKMYDNGRGMPQSDEEAVKWYTESADQGNATAQCKLAEMYSQGRGVPQSDEEAVKWYRKSAEQGFAAAQNSLGWLYKSGRGVPQSNEEAVKWYRKAVEQGNAEAQYNLGSMYANGRGVTRSDEDAVKWYSKSAEQGNANAQFYLGMMYANGIGVTRSNEEGTECFRKAAQQEHANAQFKLGDMYFIGQGVSQSDEEAVKWYRKSAEQGFAAAQNYLGWMYKSGRGVPRSYEEAVKWYKKSAEQGNASAQSYLKEMSKKAQGTCAT